MTDRQIALDGIRGIAIFLAVAYHVWQDVPADNLVDKTFEACLSFCWIGVDLFFVLSGFLITRILFETRDSPDYFRSFYARRMLRTWPLYYFALGLVLGIPALLSHRLVEVSPLWFLFHGSNYLTAFYDYPRRIVVHFWSLAIEEQFYLVWPLIRYLRTRNRMMKLCVGIILFAVALRAILSFWMSADPRTIYALTFTRMDSLAAGGLLGLWLIIPGELSKRRAVLSMIGLLCFVFLAGSLIHDGGHIKNWIAISQTLNYALIAGLCASIIGWSQLTTDQAGINRMLRIRILPFLGKYSYSIYMFHIWFDAAGRAIGIHPGTNPLLRLAGTTIPMLVYFVGLLGVTCVWALLTWRFIEGPCLSLKQRFRYLPASASPQRTLDRQSTFSAVNWQEP